MNKRLCKYKKILSGSALLYEPVKKIRSTGDICHDTAAFVLAPAMNAFILWVLQKALAAGKKRLYFLARDGYLMYKTACIYCETLKLPIECRYLYCSRYAVRIPMFHLDMEEALDYICRGGIDVTFEKILNRAGLCDSEKQKVIELLHMENQQKTVIPYANLKSIRQKLEKCRYFMSVTEKHSRDAFPKLQGYLRQEGLLDDISSAIVDSGWIGSMQKVLNQILKTMGHHTEIDGYYWGLYELPEGVRMSEYHSFYFSPSDGLKHKVFFSNCLFEVIFSAPHGMTLGYDQDGEYFRPVYAKADRHIKSAVGRTEKEVEVYTKLMAAAVKNIGDIDSRCNKKTVARLLALFMGKPLKKEAQAYGTLPFSDDVLENEKQETAPVFTEAQLKTNHLLCKTLIMFGIKKQSVRESAWYEGSAVRSSSRAWYHIYQYRLYKYMLYIRKTYLWRRKNVR